MPREPTVGIDPLRALLGEDLWELAASTVSPCTEAETLTTLPTPRLRRASFRLRFADGRVCKGRRAETGDAAARIADLWRTLAGHPQFPRLLGHRGCALLSEWIEGEVLTSPRASPEFVRQCGTFHGRLHATEPPDALRRRHAQSGDAAPAILRDCTADLLERGALAAGDARRIAELALARVPGNASVGYFHGDLCPENIVIPAGGGRFHVVDNENLSIKPHDYDLARTWHRWPMSPGLWRIYLEGYRTMRSPADFEEHFPFWTCLVLVEAAVFRLRAELPGSGQPLARLRALLAEPC